ncbi:MAG: tRNA/rRNA methyltransferase [Bacteroidales bacterium]|nr:tRNA/rRNA methyltransferase [Bacteroidales bacterium]
MHISFILVEPKVPENVGAAARALKTMGFEKLILVKPCGYKEGRARWLAHGSGDILDNAMVFETLEDAVHDFDLIIGTTARKRISKREYVEIQQLRPFLNARQGEYGKIALVFGREEAGLTNKELELCHITSTIFMAAGFPSLNLSHAVMLYTYELSTGAQEKMANDIETDRHSGSLPAIQEKIDKLLEATEISRNRTLNGRIMERLSMANVKDIKLLHSVANALIKKYGEG